MRINRRGFLAGGLVGVAWALTGKGFSAQSGSLAFAAPATPDDLPADVAWRWFELLYDIVKAERVPPTRASRVYGIAAVTLYEALVDGAASYRPLAGQLNGLVRVARPSAEVDWAAAANTALAGVVKSILPTMSAESRASVDALEAAMNVNSGGNESERRAGIERGRSVLSTIVSWASHDLSALTAPYVVSLAPDAWQPTPPAFAATPLDARWGANRPMVLGSGKDIPAAGAPRFSTAPGSEFWASAAEVYSVGLNLTAEQKLIADFWADNPGATGTPPGHWVAVVSQLARKGTLSLIRAAEAYARAGIAVHEAFICCWQAKYETNLLRPVTYIQRYIEASWQPFALTPPFPTYTSGHSTQSGAAAQALTDMLGTVAFTDTTHVDHGTAGGLGTRSYSSLLQAAMMSRLYGGIHYQFDNFHGLEAGKLIGQAVVDRIEFRRVS
jgi:hypothetical protein